MKIEDVEVKHGGVKIGSAVINHHAGTISYATRKYTDVKTGVNCRASRMETTLYAWRNTCRTKGWRTKRVAIRA